MKGSPLKLEDHLCFSLYTASRLVTRAYGPLLADLGLTYPQYLVLLALWDAPGSMTVGELGRRLRLDSGTLTPLLKRLAAAGLVHRTRDSDDERRVQVSLTEAGAALRERACDIPERIGRHLGPAAPTAKELKAALDHLIVVLSQDAPDAEAEAGQRESIQREPIQRESGQRTGRSR